MLNHPYQTRTKQSMQYPIASALMKILKTKRPTNDPMYCLNFTRFLMHKNKIDFVQDASGNITVEICKEDGTLSKCCFTAHTDTVDKKRGENKLHITPEGICTVEGGGVLGADDGAGMYILLEMILEEVPGHYVFFATEEQGRIGSQMYIMPEHIKCCISFDRKGTQDLITHQMSERGCSDNFADSLIAKLAQHGLNYKKDPTGSFTDSYSFFKTVPECINLSCGYYDQHSKQESLDIPFLESLIDAAIAIDWEDLPIERDPNAIDYSWADSYRSGWYSSPTGYSQSWSDLYKGTSIYDVDDMSDYDKLIDLITAYPDTAAEMLQAYGLTASDFIDFGGLR